MILFKNYKREFEELQHENIELKADLNNSREGTAKLREYCNELQTKLFNANWGRGMRDKLKKENEELKKANRELMTENEKVYCIQSNLYMYNNHVEKEKRYKEMHIDTDNVKNAMQTKDEYKEILNALYDIFNVTNDTIKTDNELEFIHVGYSLLKGIEITNYDNTNFQGSTVHLDKEGTKELIKILISKLLRL